MYTTRTVVVMRSSFSTNDIECAHSVAVQYFFFFFIASDSISHLVSPHFEIATGYTEIIGMDKKESHIEKWSITINGTWFHFQMIFVGTEGGSKTIPPANISTLNFRSCVPRRISQTVVRSFSCTNVDEELPNDKIGLEFFTQLINWFEFGFFFFIV